MSGKKKKESNNRFSTFEAPSGSPPSSSNEDDTGQENVQREASTQDLIDESLVSFKEQVMAMIQSSQENTLMLMQQLMEKNHGSKVRFDNSSTSSTSSAVLSAATARGPSPTTDGYSKSGGQRIHEQRIDSQLVLAHLNDSDDDDGVAPLEEVAVQPVTVCSTPSSVLSSNTRTFIDEPEDCDADATSISDIPPTNSAKDTSSNLDNSADFETESSDMIESDDLNLAFTLRYNVSTFDNKVMQLSIQEYIQLYKRVNAQVIPIRRIATTRSTRRVFDPGGMLVVVSSPQAFFSCFHQSQLGLGAVDAIESVAARFRLVLSSFGLVMVISSVIPGRSAVTAFVRGLPPRLMFKWL